MLGSLLHRGSRHDAHNQAHDHRWFVFKTIARRFTSVYLPREEDTVNALVDAGQKLKNPQMGLSETLVLVPQMWLMVNNDLLFLKLPLVGYATVPETQEHHLGYCIIYIYTHVRILCPDSQFNPMKSPLQLNPMKGCPWTVEAMISLLSPLLPVAQMLDVPVLDFDAYLKLQDSQDVAKEAWQNRMPLINRSDTKPWFLRGLFHCL